MGNSLSGRSSITDAVSLFDEIGDYDKKHLLMKIGYHGHHKPRGSEPKFWTHRSRKGAFGRKLWKKWFNNAAMNRFENRLNEPNSVRKGSERYEMRRLGPKSVNTRESRQA